MTTLFNSYVKVKPARTARRFGQGLTAYIPQHHFADHSVSDAAELLAMEVARYEAAEAQLAALDRQADQFERIAAYRTRMDRGCHA